MVDDELVSSELSGGSAELDHPHTSPEFVVARRAQVRQRVRTLEARKAGVAAQMRGLVAAYRGAFREPPARIVLQRLQGGHLYLRWRVSQVRGDRFLVNPQDEQTQHWICTLPFAFKTVFLDYLRQGLDLNLLHGMFHVETLRLRQYLDDRQALDAIGERAIDSSAR